jgi:hypothetical protein
MRNVSPKIPEFELALKALIDTNYRTYLNDYLSTNQISASLLNNTVPSVSNASNAWKQLLM